METLDIIVDHYIQNTATGEEYPVIFQNDEMVVFLQPSGKTDYLLKEFMSDGRE